MRFKGSEVQSCIGEKVQRFIWFVRLSKVEARAKYLTQGLSHSVCHPEERRIALVARQGLMT